MILKQWKKNYNKFLEDQEKAREQKEQAETTYTITT